MHKSGVWILLALLSAVLGGCAEGPYVYRPAQAATSMSGLPASRQPIPRDKPSGDIVVASSGMTELKGTDPPMRAVFARVVVTNRSDDVPWTLDTRKQQAILGGQATTAAFVNAHEGYEGATSDVRVPKGQSRTIDFYFPVAAGADELPPFELSWNIQTGQSVVADRAVFERVRVEPAYVASGPYPSYYYGGPYGYYDPFWPPPFYMGVHVGYGYPRYYGYPRAHYHVAPRIYYRGRIR